MLDYLRDAVVLGGVYTIFALGLTLSWGVLNVLNLAHGSVLVASALAAYLLTVDAALPLWVLMPACVLVGALLGVALELLVFRPIHRRAHSEEDASLSILIGSVAAGAFLFAISNRITDGRVRSIDPRAFRIEEYSIAGTRVSNIQILIVAIALLATVALGLFVNRTRQGRALRALAFDPGACGLLGISASRLALTTMATAGALAGASGLLLALYIGSVEASMTGSLLLKAFAVIVVGGVGSVYGTLLGAYLIASAEVATVANLGSGLRDAVVFTVILVILLCRPQGLLARAAWQRA